MGCAAVACGIAAGISNIVDVVKTRWQTSILSTTEETSSTRRIATQLFRQGGLASFTRGMGARIMWMVPSVTISMSTFEWLKAHGFTGALAS
jgi:solute carrier family 25 S-adenosylmethionine transporter 26